MKKFLLAALAVILSVCAYANTCEYDGVQVTIEQSRINSNGRSPSWPKADFSCNVPNKTVRVQVQLKDDNGNEIARQWVTVSFDANGNGRAEIKYVPSGGCRIQLIGPAPSCY